MPSEKPTLLAVIPARGGSKGLPRKNVYPLGGLPLIGWSIKAAQEAKSVGRVVVTTDDAEIAAVSRDLGAHVIMRPAQLADDKALTIDAVLHALESLDAAKDEADCAYMVLLQPTSPLRTAAHIDAAAAVYFQHKPASLISVVEEEHSPFKNFVMEAGTPFLKPLFGERELSQPRQALPKVYRQNGALYITPIAALRAQRAFYLAPCLSFEMGREESIDIDTLHDIQTVEKIIHSRQVI